MMSTMLRRFLLLLTATVVVADDYSHLLQCLTQGSDSHSTCSAMDDCVWCTAKNGDGLCVSSLAAAFFTGDSHYQCSKNGNDDDDDTTPTTDDDDTDDDDYFPSADDDATFDDDAAVDDDAATTDDDANDDVDTDDYNPYVDDDQSPTTDDDETPNTDDDSNADEYMRKLLECLAVGQETSCSKNSPTECVWCTTSFGEGLCVSDEAGKDIDGYFYTCKWNATTTFSKTNKEEEEATVDSSVYDHYCWNAQDEAACEQQVDGRDLLCVWCTGSPGDAGTCLSQAQTDLVETCQTEATKQE